MFFKADYKIGISLLNKSNKLSNKGILALFEDTAEMHSASVGFGITDIEKTKHSWALLNWKVKILKRPSHGDHVTIKTWARGSEKLFCFRDFELIDSLSGNTIAIATSKWIFIDIANNKISKLDNDLLEKYKMENVQVFCDKESNELSRIKEIENYSNSLNYKIRKSDIDINNHVNNLCYLDMAEEILPNEISNFNESNEFEIWYKHQIKYGDNVIVNYGVEDNVHYVVVKSNNNEYLHNVMKFK